MNSKKSTQLGFTLIELLVVVSIISLLSSVVLASLNGARGKGRDAAIRQEVLQLRTLMELNYNESGSYLNLQSGVQWVTGGGYTCNTITLGGIYATQARAICSNIISLQSSSTTTTEKFILANNIDMTNRYSIMAWLPYKSVYLCMGSSGGTSETSTGNIVGGASPGWSQSGCWNNP